MFQRNERMQNAVYKGTQYSWWKRFKGVGNPLLKAIIAIMTISTKKTIVIMMMIMIMMITIIMIMITTTIMVIMMMIMIMMMTIMIKIVTLVKIKCNGKRKGLLEQGDVSYKIQREKGCLRKGNRRKLCIYQIYFTRKACIPQN